MLSKLQCKAEIIHNVYEKMQLVSYSTPIKYINFFFLFSTSWAKYVSFTPVAETASLRCQNFQFTILHMQFYSNVLEISKPVHF